MLDIASGSANVVKLQYQTSIKVGPRHLLPQIETGSIPIRGNKIEVRFDDFCQAGHYPRRPEVGSEEL